MRGFRKLAMLAVLLVTLLLVFGTIDAGKKQAKKQEIENEVIDDQETSRFVNKNQQTESIKHKRVKRSGTQKICKSEKCITNDRKMTDNENTKTSNPFHQNMNTYKVFDEEPAQKFDWRKTKKLNPEYRSENYERVFKTVKNTSQNELFEEDENVENFSNEELKKLKNKENISVKETTDCCSKKKKAYKLVEVVLEEERLEEDKEENDNTIEFRSEDEECENINNEILIGKNKIILCPKSKKNRKPSKKASVLEEYHNGKSEKQEFFSNDREETLESGYSDSMFFDDSFPSRYEEPGIRSCKSLPHDPNRKGPKKLVFYVIEEEVNGQIKKRVVHEEDGVTMCEVVDLLGETYGNDIPEE